MSGGMRVSRTGHYSVSVAPPEGPAEDQDPGIYMTPTSNLPVGGRKQEDKFPERG